MREWNNTFSLPCAKNRLHYTFRQHTPCINNSYCINASQRRKKMGWVAGRGRSYLQKFTTIVSWVIKFECMCKTPLSSLEKKFQFALVIKVSCLQSEKLKLVVSSLSDVCLLTICLINFLPIWCLRNNY